MIDADNAESPFVRIQMLLEYDPSSETEALILDEIKLLGNIFHSAIRNKIAEFIKELNKATTKPALEELDHHFNEFCNELEHFRELFFMVQDKCANKWPSQEVKWTFKYIDEFISLNTNDYFLGFLNRIRSKFLTELKPIDERICKVILKESEYRQEAFNENGKINKEPQHDEFVLYRKELLKKFVMDPLLLKIDRTSVSQRYRNVIGVIPAGIAMLVYSVIFFIWFGSGEGNSLLINSQWLILLSVIVYSASLKTVLKKS